MLWPSYLSVFLPFAYLRQNCVPAAALDRFSDSDLVSVRSGCTVAGRCPTGLDQVQRKGSLFAVNEPPSSSSSTSSLAKM